MVKLESTTVTSMQEALDFLEQCTANHWTVQEMIHHHEPFSHYEIRYFTGKDFAVSE